MRQQIEWIKKDNLRFIILISFLSLALLVLLWRIVDLTVFDRSFLKSQGDARSLRVIDIPAYRGMITDRNGEPLAVSTTVESVWANPKDFEANEKQISQLAKLLNISSKYITERITQAEGKEFVYLKRGLDPVLAGKVKALDIPGVNLLKEFRRYYPEGEVTSHVLGFTNIDDNGQEGLELAYDEWLSGIPGKKRVLKDRMGHIVADIDNIREPKPGRNLALSIDRRIQYIAYRELKTAVKKHRANSASVVVLEANTGEVLAMVNQPAFNPNRRTKLHDQRYRNRAVTDLFEPGSVIKAFSVANGLESGKYTPETEIDTSPGVMRVGKNVIRDFRNYGSVTLEQGLKKSSNVAMAKMTLSLPGDNLWSLLTRVGFGETTGIGFPGEAVGTVLKQSVWRPFELATLSFGYGISATPLQIAYGYSVFANQGKLIPLSLLKQDKTPYGKQVLKPDVVKQMVNLLEAVVEQGGSGKKSQVEGYSVAGKTGTARIASTQGYDKNRHIATFAGFAPTKNPKLIIVVVINEPSAGMIYGGQVAAPVFSDIMSESLRVLDVPPDRRV